MVNTYKANKSYLVLCKNYGNEKFLCHCQALSEALIDC